jgi:hypothetical protein
MSSVADELHSNQRFLASQWSEARVLWQDESAAHFEHNSWDPLEVESSRIGASADELMVALVRCRLAAES